METKTIVVAGGCFWGVEYYYSLVKGVINTTSGYCGGFSKYPTYEEVYSELTGHTESVKIDYNPKETNIKKLLDHYFHITDPTSLNFQKGDFGTRYRSVLFYSTNDEKIEILNYISSIKHKFSNPIVTEVIEFKEFWKAEDYHQKYLLNNPDGYCHLNKSYFMKVKEIDDMI